MNRRGFFGLLFGAAAAKVLAPMLPEAAPVTPIPFAGMTGLTQISHQVIPLSELSAIAHRAFIPKMVEQIYASTPTLSAMLCDPERAYALSGGSDDEPLDLYDEEDDW